MQTALVQYVQVVCNGAAYRSPSITDHERDGLISLDSFSPCYSTEGRIQGEPASGSDFGGSPSPAAASSALEGMGNLEFVARSVY